MRRQKGRCQYAGVLIRSVVSIWGANSEAAEVFWEEQMRRKGMERDRGEPELIKWMGRKVRWGGIESNEMCRAMVRLHEVVMEEAVEM